MDTLEKELNQAEKFNFSFEDYIKNELNISLENNTGNIIISFNLFIFIFIMSV